MIPQKKLSICADDFGITEKVNRVIIKLIEAKRITETSCIVLSDFFFEDAKQLIKYQNNIGIGIHLTLTDFSPLSEIKSLTNNGKLIGITNLLMKSFIQNYSVSEIHKEINLQLDKFEKTLGFRPDFIDGHHHIHQLPLIRNIIINIIKKRYPSNYPWIRNSNENFFRIFKRKTSIIKSIFLSVMGKKIKKLAKRNSIKTNNGFSGIYNFSIDQDYGKLFKNFINDINSDHLIMVHPGENDEILSNIDSANKSRNLEFNYLISEKFSQVLIENNIELKKLFS
jgi:predicted glycoside hydrolase/deacetylase ChbG (UPF0249 family)